MANCSPARGGLISAEEWREEIAAATLSVQVNYHDGVRFPHLERVTGTDDLLTRIAAPRVR